MKDNIKFLKIFFKYNKGKVISLSVSVLTILMILIFVDVFYEKEHLLGYDKMVSVSEVDGEPIYIRKYLYSRDSINWVTKYELIGEDKVGEYSKGDISVLIHRKDEMSHGYFILLIFSSAYILLFTIISIAEISSNGLYDYIFEKDDPTNWCMLHIIKEYVNSCVTQVETDEGDVLIIYKDKYIIPKDFYNFHLNIIEHVKIFLDYKEFDIYIDTYKERVKNINKILKNK